MISLDMKNEAKTASSPLSLSTPKDEPKQSFSELLKGQSEKKDGKLIQNGALILSLGEQVKETNGSKDVSKVDTLISLLKNEEGLDEKLEELMELNPKLVSSLSEKDIKTLVLGAKDYLKTIIEGSDDYKKSLIKELPHTLKGLTEVAKKFGIDISKITLEDVKVKTDSKVKTPEIKVDTSHIKDTEQNKEVKSKPSHIKELLQEKEVKVQPLHVKGISQEKEAKVQPLHVKEISQEKEVKVQPLHVKEISQEKEAKVQPLHVKDISEDKDIKVITPHVKKTAKTVDTAANELPKEQQYKEQLTDEKLSQISKEVKTTPLFKAQMVVEHTTTEQIAQVKANSSLSVEQKTPKERADETLKLLLRGEKPAMNNSVLTADFSVATAKVIAPSAASDATKSLEKLLHGESSPSEQTTVKTDGLTAHKADSFEVKLNEAKQMIKYLSTDMKTAIEDYKSPFTRVKVQLNPQRLGEVDLTIVQRGKNLHVNISSNNTAVNTLAMNANELRVQLSNSGINNATLNFSNNSQNSDSNAGGQHQQRQNEQQAHEEYNYFDSDESVNEEVLSSLEIIVPHYG
ncbi:flagellar hook-length control protein FliK [Candidatus Sulfurimonas marisnigri]|uniref:Flagellar hook-length control protein FliK n=1 Tax=Candidatus Sulfurimonas marisnigri TaxID=2740405 RepID=A0A7S7RPS4_9BACT|nr:flagellar hook-length control protein FliK [Candidatus Sulfurimonas marisnigri]QOY54702.1 flagellar hook-length control protein FliK [Candidatus Sulfurimonas marisnigri]